MLPEGFGYEWTGTTYQEQKTGNMATYIFALSIVCVFLFMSALYESWIRPAGDHPDGAPGDLRRDGRASGSTTCRWTSSARSAW